MRIAPVFVGAALLLYRLEDVAGLHRDEAAFGLFAEMIQEGLRPIQGLFNIYTSPIHSYIIAGFFSMFGENKKLVLKIRCIQSCLMHYHKHYLKMHLNLVKIF